MLIISCLCHWLMQLCWLVTWFLVHLQETNPQTWGCEHWYVELKTNRRFDPIFIFQATTEKNLALQETLKFSLKLLNPPNNSRMFRLILSSSNKSIRSNRSSTFGWWYFNNNTISIQIFIINRFNLNPNLKFIRTNLTIMRHNLKR